MFNQSHSNISIGVTYKQRTKDTAKAFLSQINEKGLGMFTNYFMYNIIIIHSN